MHSTELTIKRQPNGLLAIWSSVVNSFVHHNCTPEQVREVYRRRLGSHMAYGPLFEQEIETALKSGISPFLNQSPDWEDCVAIMCHIHGGTPAKDAELNAFIAACAEPCDEPSHWDVERIMASDANFERALRAGNRAAVLADLLTAAGAGDRLVAVRLAAETLRVAEARSLAVDVFEKPWVQMHHRPAPRSEAAAGGLRAALPLA